jgi:signal transduction histidine kinase/ActR/RegA family two-component response regulator
MPQLANDNETPKSDLKKPKDVAINLSNRLFEPLIKIQHKIKNLTIQGKIKFGYIVALGIAMSGSLSGVAISDYWQRQALEQRQRLRQERKLLSELLTNTLSLQGAIAFPPSQQKSQIEQAKSLSITTKKLLVDLNSIALTSANPKIKLLTQYEKLYFKFLQSLETLETKKTSKVQQLLSNLANSNDNIQTQEFTNQLVAAIRTAEQQEDKAEKSLQQVEIQRIIIIFFSVNLSAAAAYFFALYTSRAIARPITELSQVTQQAIKKANIHQKIDVNTDELTIITTYLHELTQQIQTLVEAQKDAEASADAAHQAKNKFLANMSHELRTPLNGILGYAQILARSQNLSDEQKHGISTIYQCGFHLLNLINDILDLSKIEAQKLELKPTDFHLPSFIQGVVEICQIKAEQKGIEFVYQPPKNLPTGVTTDKKRLRQVLINLLNNAIKFTDAGCVELQVKVSNSQLSPSHVKINFSVFDTGVGMNSEQIEKIFLPFEQVVNNDTQTGGTGLGLTISQKVIEMMGSKIQVKSQFGTGSLFEFTIDCPVPEDWTESSTITSRGKIIGYSGGHTKILIVDDYWENRSLLISLLEPLNFTVIEASNGQEGFEKATIFHPDLIICDTAMPIMDGWDMLAKMRKSELFQDTLIILTSPNIYEIDRQKTLAAGADDFLTRPLQAEELYSILAKRLQINWIYATPSIEPPEEPVTVMVNEMVIPPVSDLTMLLEYVRKGQIKGIKQELDRIARIDEKYYIFVRQLSKYAKNLNIQKIRTFIQENINK